MLAFTFMMVSLAGKTFADHHGPCHFNNLCTCRFNSNTSTYESLEITCLGVPLTSKPPTPPSSFLPTKLSLVDSGLELLEDASLRDYTYLTELNLAYNKLHFVPPWALSHFSQNLQTLDLSYNNLQNVPEVALRNCTVLKVLSLERNEIANLKIKWGSLEGSLEFLFLGGNDLVQLPVSLAFTLGNLNHLKTLNLDDNGIRYLEENSLPFNLSTLSVAGNQIEEFPSALFNNLYALRTLNMADNRIRDLPVFKNKFGKSVDSLDLSDNLIRSVENIFGKSCKIEQLFLSRNKIDGIYSRAFDGIDCRRIDLSGNQIHTVHDNAFQGLSSIENINLSSNKLTRLPNALSSLKKLKKLFFSHNGLTSFPDSGFFRNSSDRLSTLALSHNHIKRVPTSSTMLLRRLDNLNLGYNEISSASFFPFFSNNVNTLSLESNSIGKIDDEDFKYLTELQKLNLAYNPLLEISSDAFNKNIRLESLDLGFALKSAFLPETVFSNLENLKELNLNNNGLTAVSERVFLNLHRLKCVNLAFNRLSSLPRTLFQGSIHKDLSTIYLSFNWLDTIESNTLSDLHSLQFVSFSYNRIRKIEQSAFKGLGDSLSLDLSHNLIQDIRQGAFIGLPRLFELDLSHNEMSVVDWRMFDNVTRSDHPMTLNLSRNRIGGFLNEEPRVHIRTLDLSHNLLDAIPSDSLMALATTLKLLNLGYNRVKEICDNSLVNGLVSLNLEHNIIERMDDLAFKDVKSLQVIDLSHNHISEVPHFKHLPNLRVVNLSNNLINFVPEDCFTGANIERLFLGHNQLTKVPVNGLASLGGVIRVLDLSYNKIDGLIDDQFKPIPDLIDLDLSHNSLTRLQENACRHLNSLIRLKLGGNDVGQSLGNFNVNSTLYHLDLSHTRMTDLPFLQQPTLASLNLSGNGISQLKYGFLVGLPALKSLDLSRNNLTTLSTAGWILSGSLTYLDVSNNPIQVLERNSFQGLNVLKILNIQNLKNLEVLNLDAFSDLVMLKWLKFQTWPNLSGKLSSVLASMGSLRALSVQATESEMSDEQLGDLPEKLRLLEITGEKLEMIRLSALGDLTTSFPNELTIRVTQTNISMLPSYFFTKYKADKLTVDLRGNNLVAIGRHNFYHSQKSLQRHGTLRYKGGIYLEGNNLICDCGAQWMASWLRRYLHEVVKYSKSNQIYFREKIDEMMKIECFDPSTGGKIKLLTFENAECKPPVSVNVSPKREIGLVTLFALILCHFTEI